MLLAEVGKARGGRTPIPTPQPATPVKVNIEGSASLKGKYGQPWSAAHMAETPGKELGGAQ